MKSVKAPFRNLHNSKALFEVADLTELEYRNYDCWIDLPNNMDDLDKGVVSECWGVNVLHNGIAVTWAF